MRSFTLNKMIWMKQEKSILIKKALPEDAGKFLDLNEKYNGKESVNEDISKIEKILEDNENDLVFVVFSDNLLTGSICAQIYESFCYSRPALEITKLYVENGKGRQRAVTLLINEVLNLPFRRMF